MQQSTLPRNAAPLLDGECNHAFVGVYKVNIQCLSPESVRSVYRVWVTAGGFQVEGLEHTYDSEARALRAFGNAQTMLAEAPALGAQPAPASTEPALSEPALKVLLSGIAAEDGVVDSLGGLAPPSFQVPLDQKLVEAVEGVTITRREYGISTKISSVRVIVRLTEKGAQRAVRELARLAAQPDGPSRARYARVTTFIDRTRDAQAARELVNA